MSNLLNFIFLVSLLYSHINVSLANETEVDYDDFEVIPEVRDESDLARYDEDDQTSSSTSRNPFLDDSSDTGSDDGVESIIDSDEEGSESDDEDPIIVDPRFEDEIENETQTAGSHPRDVASSDTPWLRSGRRRNVMDPAPSNVPEATVTPPSVETVSAVAAVKDTSEPPVSETVPAVETVTPPVTGAPVIRAENPLLNPELPSETAEAVSIVTQPSVKMRIRPNTMATPTVAPVVVNFEREKTDNMTYKFDLESFVQKVDASVITIYHFLARLRNHSPIRNEFKELSNIFYAVLFPPMSHEDSNKECMRRESRLYEISSQYRLDLLRQMTHRQVPLMDTVEEGQAFRMWLDVEQDPDGTLNYPSGDPIATFLDREFHNFDQQLRRDHCVYFDLNKLQYGQAHCSAKLLTVCYIPKTPKLMQEKLFLENINDEINNLQFLKMRKNAKTLLKVHLRKMESGSCPTENNFSLFKALGLDYPLSSVRLQEKLDVQVYQTMVQRLTQDVMNFNRIMFDGNFENNLKVALGYLDNIQAFYDQTKKTVCFFRKVFKGKPKAIEVVLSELEQRINSTLNSSSHFTKDRLNEISSNVEKKIENSLGNRPSRDAVIAMVNKALETVNNDIGKKVDKVVEISNATHDDMIKKIMSRVNEEIKESEQVRGLSDSQIEKNFEGVLLRVNETISDVISATNETISGNPFFYKFSLLDIILAGAASLLLLIGFSNTVCYAVLRRKIGKNRAQSFNDLELTPIARRNIKFGKDRVKEYNAELSSIDTFPSPEPTVRKSHRK